MVNCGTGHREWVGLAIILDGIGIYNRPPGTRALCLDSLRLGQSRCTVSVEGVPIDQPRPSTSLPKLQRRQAAADERLSVEGQIPKGRWTGSDLMTHKFGLVPSRKSWDD